jgi:hypothetical protein
VPKNTQHRGVHILLRVAYRAYKNKVLTTSRKSPQSVWRLLQPCTLVDRSARPEQVRALPVAVGDKAKLAKAQYMKYFTVSFKRPETSSEVK